MFSPDHKCEIEREMPAIIKTILVFMKKIENMKITCIWINTQGVKIK